MEINKSCIIEQMELCHERREGFKNRVNGEWKLLIISADVRGEGVCDKLKEHLPEARCSQVDA